MKPEDHLVNLTQPTKGSESLAKCWCLTCRPLGPDRMEMVVCPECGCKRCPRARNHANACTGKTGREVVDGHTCSGCEANRAMLDARIYERFSVNNEVSGQVNQMDPCSLSSSLKSLEGKNELLPCPFCGKAAETYAMRGYWCVLCSSCEGEGPPSDHEGGAIAYWNRRQSSGVLTPGNSNGVRVLPAWDCGRPAPARPATVDECRKTCTHHVTCDQHGCANVGVLGTVKGGE